MANRERAKGLAGEHEVAQIWTAKGWEVRGLEGLGDQYVSRNGLLLHSEVKRQEVARPWAWWEQASNEATALSLPVVVFRRNRSPWLAITSFTMLADYLGRDATCA